MVDPESLNRRLLILNDAAFQLRQHPRAEDPDALRADPLLRAAVERWLQVCVEACIEMAYHVIAQQGWTPPTSAKDSFTTLASHQIIPPNLAKRLGLAAGLRNVLVHDYTDVEPDLVAAVVRDDLDDLDRFADHIRALLAD